MCLFMFTVMLLGDIIVEGLCGYWILADDGQMDKQLAMALPYSFIAVAPHTTWSAKY